MRFLWLGLVEVHTTSAHALSDRTSTHGVQQIEETVRCLLSEAQKDSSHWGAELLCQDARHLFLY